MPKRRRTWQGESEFASSEWVMYSTYNDRMHKDVFSAQIQNPDGQYTYVRSKLRDRASKFFSRYKQAGAVQMMMLLCLIFNLFLVSSSRTNVRWFVDAVLGLRNTEGDRGYWFLEYKDKVVSDRKESKHES